jgi:hypothetical protein
MSDPAPDLDALKQRWLAAIGVSASTTGTYKQTQQLPVYLPQVFAGNEEGKRTMTKAELETFIDHRWRSRCESFEKEVETLKRRVNELENKGK